MKIVVYQGQQKITVANAYLSNFAEINDYIQEHELEDQISQKYNFQITSTRGMIDEEEIESEDIRKEFEEGINWQQVTVN